MTHPDPYPYYAELVATRPLHRDEALGLWVAAGADAVTSVLTSDICRVRPPSEPVPRALLAFDVDVLCCARCGGRLRLIATILDPRAIQALLRSLRRPTETPNRAPPSAFRV